jgi:assimilatory nitrate reductase catalytic subunit
VVVESRRGQARVRAFITPTVPRGHLFLPMHDRSTNRLTNSVFDPESRQPAYKACAARVRAARTQVAAHQDASSTFFGSGRE